jgi:acyl-CoA thioesterase
MNEADAVDIALAYASHSHGDPALARSCDIEFLAPATPGTTLRAVATRRRGLVRGSIYDVAITGPDGVIVAALRSDDRPYGRGRRTTTASG